MKIYSVYDPEFRPYGKVLEGYDTACLVNAMNTIPLPESGTAYEPSIPVLETTCLYSQFQNNTYGGMPIQLGMCWGRNTKLNCLEYHRDSEVNIGTDDFILLLANSVPASVYESDIKGKFDYQLTDTFMGFHCGNTPACKLCEDRAVKYQLIQHRLLEPKGSEPDFTRGTLEGDIAASDITFYRLQCDSEGVLRSYIAQGEVLPVATRSFGGIGVFAIPEMGRFYRHVLIQKRYPHHGAVAFGHYGKALFEVFKFLGVGDIAYNQPKALPYPTENPFA